MLTLWRCKFCLTRSITSDNIQGHFFKTLLKGFVIFLLISIKLKLMLTLWRRKYLMQIFNNMNADLIINLTYVLLGIFYPCFFSTWENGCPGFFLRCSRCISFFVCNPFELKVWIHDVLMTFDIAIKISTYVYV